MRMLGLIGGCSAESTSIYYQELNRRLRSMRPGHGARLVLWSFDVEDIDACCRQGDWTAALAKFAEAACWLEDAGAEAILICTNTMHRIADDLTGSLRVPLLHIADAAGVGVTAAGRKTPLLLGTRYLMREAFYPERLARHGLSALLPTAEEQEVVHAVIYDELMSGFFSDRGREALRSVIASGIERGADSVILACTELGMAIKPGEVAVPVFDSALLHVDAGLAFALGDRGEAVAKAR